MDRNEWSRLDVPAELNMETTNRDLIIRSYVFQDILGPGGQCIVQLEVRREGGRAGFFTKILKVNEPPKDGNCSCYPPTGEISNTEFQVSCDNWQDPDKPLRYSFTYGNDAKPLLIALDKPSSSRTFRIYKQVAEEITSVLIPITVSIEDALGLSSKINFKIEVRLSTFPFLTLLRTREAIPQPWYRRVGGGEGVIATPTPLGFAMLNISCRVFYKIQKILWVIGLLRVRDVIQNG